MSGGITLHDVTLRTGDGLDLEAEITTTAAPRFGVVLCHPHPLQGGNMRSLVPSELFRLLPEAGIAALRFNFRGVDGSQGEHGRGTAEHLDVIAGIDALADALPTTLLIVIGWSFGADVALTVLDPRLAGWVGVAPPLRVVSPEAMVASTDPRPKLLVIPEHDQFNPPERARSLTAHWVATSVETVAGADHFLVGRTGRVADLVERFGQELLDALGGG